MQQQAMQRPITEQSMLEANALKQTEEKRTTASVVDETDKTLIRDKDYKNPQGKAKKDKKDDKQEDEASSDQADEKMHPYKGHRLDIRL